MRKYSLHTCVAINVRSIVETFVQLIREDVKNMPVNGAMCPSTMSGVQWRDETLRNLYILRREYILLS